MKEFRYRHELKFLCTQLQIELLRNQLDILMERDKHCLENGAYRVRSLYFDDYADSALYQKEDGVDYRRKYRIRSYPGGEEEYLHLEIKHRVKDKIRKESCMVSRSEVQQILNDLPLEDAFEGESVLRRFEYERECSLLKPSVIVEYDRIPYVCADGNVRITIDRNICASMQTERFLEPEIMGIPILETGHHLLEIKYDEYLPYTIKQALQIVSLQKTAFSKYYLCRLVEKERKC